MDETLADQHHDVVVLDEAGRRVGSRRVTHSKKGLEELKQFLLGITPHLEELAWVGETSHGLLITFLLEAAIPVYPVNPKTANALRKAAGAKTDQIDASLLAKTGRFDLADLRRLQPDSPKVQEVKPLTRDQDALVQMQTRLVNQLTACLKGSYPVALTFRTLFLTHEDQAIFASLPGAGKRLAPRLLAEWGEDRSRYSDAERIQTLAGTAPVPFKSGNYAKAHKRFACLKPLRNVLYQFAWQSTRQEAWARDDYRRKRTEGKSRSMAVRALAQIWARIIYRMWESKTCYHSETFEAAQRAHARHAA